MTVTGLNFHQLHELVLITDPKMTGGKDIYLYNNDTTFSKKSQQKEKGKYTWTLTPQEWKKLVCENPEFYIGGKIIYTSRTGKDFYADKTVYLSNRFNTVIKSTRTNRFGMFAFEGLKPDEIYFIGIDTSGIKPGDKFDLLNKEDQFAGRLDSLKGKRRSFRLRTDGSDAHQMLLLDEKDLRMDIKAKIYQKNAGEKLDASIVLMNDKYQPIDSVKVNNVGEFTFKYLKFIKRFFLEIEPENDVSLDQLTQLLLYGKEGEFIKAFSNLKGKKFVYKPIPAEINKMREITLEDPWMELSMNVPSSSNPPAISEKILFEFNQYTILENSKDILNKIAIVLKENPSYHLLITAHTDCIGNPKDNLVLSQKRAEAVKQYLIQKGIDGKRLTTQGFGEEKLLNHCKDGVDCSEMEHAVNRRVEFTIIKK
jgi:outer membrane protein OmpA-like peptidoglycan-associated protein